MSRSTADHYQEERGSMLALDLKIGPFIASGKTYGSKEFQSFGTKVQSSLVVPNVRSLTEA